MVILKIKIRKFWNEIEMRKKNHYTLTYLPNEKEYQVEYETTKYIFSRLYTWTLFALVVLFDFIFFKLYVRHSSIFLSFIKRIVHYGFSVLNLNWILWNFSQSGSDIVKMSFAQRKLFIPDKLKRQIIYEHVSEICISQAFISHARFICNEIRLNILSEM